jgi:hypothetical protein
VYFIRGLVLAGLHRHREDSLVLSEMTIQVSRSYGRGDASANIVRVTARVRAKKMKEC